MGNVAILMVVVTVMLSVYGVGSSVCGICGGSQSKTL